MNATFVAKLVCIDVNVELTVSRNAAFKKMAVFSVVFLAVPTSLRQMWRDAQNIVKTLLQNFNSRVEPCEILEASEIAKN